MYVRTYVSMYCCSCWVLLSSQLFLWCRIGLDLVTSTTWTSSGTPQALMSWTSWTGFLTPSWGQSWTHWKSLSRERKWKGVHNFVVSTRCGEPDACTFGISCTYCVCMCVEECMNVCIYVFHEWLIFTCIRQQFTLPWLPLPLVFSLHALLQGGAQPSLDCCAEHPEGLCGLPPHVGGGASHGGGMVGGVGGGREKGWWVE